MRPKLNVMIGDSSASMQNRLEEWLERTAVTRVVDRHGDARSLATAIARLRPDAVIIESKLPPVGAFMLSNAIDPGMRPKMIITSDDPEDAVQAFESRAFDFLRRPVTEERLHDSVLRAHTAVLVENEGRRAHRRIAVRHGPRTILIKLEEIDWIEAAGNYVRIHTGERSWLMRETMSGIEGKLPCDGFVRIQRSVIVNLERVDSLRNDKKDDLTVLLDDATELPLSRTYREGFELALGM